MPKNGERFERTRNADGKGYEWRLSSFRRVGTRRCHGQGAAWRSGHDILGHALRRSAAA